MAWELPQPRKSAAILRSAVAIMLVLACQFPAAGAGAASLSAEMDILRARGLVSTTAETDTAPAAIPSPLPGTEVRVYKAGREDKALDASMIEWEERAGDDILAFLILGRDGARQVSYWLLPADSIGCLIYSYRIIDPSGHVIRSAFWQRTDLIKTADGGDFPVSLYPFGPNGGMPPGEVIRAIGNPQSGATATMYTQFTPDGFVILDSWVDGTEEITTTAGKFDAVRIVMRPNVRSFLPSWPGFILKTFQPFLPRETFYFEAHPPYRFLEYRGVPGASGPVMKSEIVRYYTQGTAPQALSSK